MTGPLRIAAVLAGALVLGTMAPLGAAGPDDEYPHGSFEGDCATCHRIEEWNAVKPGPDFDHGKISGFPLKGAHEGIYCRVCHKNLDFTRASPACADCHSDVHRGEFGGDCARCHSKRNPIERSMDLERHRLTRLPLEGVHATLDCRDCHRPAAKGRSDIGNAPAECERCHLDRYKAAKNPDHVASGFPQDCSQCHTPVGWDKTRFDHDQRHFPIYSGTHQGRWNTCTTCHTDPSCYAQLSCFGCHPHSDKTRTDADHRGESGYSYDGRACYHCHPTGRAED